MEGAITFFGEKGTVKIGGKAVEVCCEECATKLREASSKQKKK